MNHRLTKEYLRELIAKSKWDGNGMLVSQDRWREYLTWALDQLDAKEVALQRHAEVALVDPKQKTRAKRKKLSPGFGDRMP